MAEYNDRSADIVDSDFVQSVEVQTEYEKGWAAGQAALQSTCELAFQQALANELEIEALQARVKELRMRLSGDVAQRTGLTIGSVAEVIDPVAFDPISLDDKHPSWECRREQATETAKKIIALAAQPPAAPVETKEDFNWDLPAKLRADFLHGEIAVWNTLVEAADEIERLRACRSSAGNTGAVVLEESETLQGHTVQTVRMPDGSEETHILPHSSHGEYSRCMDMLGDVPGDTLEDRIERLISSHLELLSRDEPQEASKS